MKTRAWQRAVAHVLLTTFLTGIVGCGDATHDAASSTTTTAAEAVAQAADTIPPTESPPPPTDSPSTPPPTLPDQPPAQLGKDELRDLVAPVALYPDVVLSSLLPATTYPEQVREAAEYVGAAETVDQVPEDREWDGSIVGLLQFPDVVRWLDSNPAWTDQMGQAVTYQQADVLQAIQDYRRAVQTAGNLQSNQYQKVRTGSNQDIYIEPARPDVVYVPSYDPVVATQPQPAPAPGINPWLAFGGGAVVGALGAWALYSIFDDDDDGGDNYYYGGGGRRIRGYDNYYYSRGRRPRTVAWAPRQRPYRRVENWRRPRRLEYVAPKERPGRRNVALRPPTKRAGAPPPLSTEVKPDRRKGNRQGQGGGGQRRAQDQRQRKAQQPKRQQPKTLEQSSPQQQRKRQQGQAQKRQDGQGQRAGQQGARQRKRQDEARRQQQQRQQQERRERRQEQKRMQQEAQGGGGQRQGGQAQRQEGNGNGDGGGQKKGGGGQGGGGQGGGGGKKNNKKKQQGNQ